MNYDTDNIFAKILKGEIPSEEVYSDKYVYAFHDISKAAPVHVLVIPKDSYVDFADFAENAKPDEVSYFFTKVSEIAQSLGVAEEGYRLVTNKGHNGSQTVPHFHVHILGGRQLGGLLPGDAEVR